MSSFYGLDTTLAARARELPLSELSHSLIAPVEGARTSPRRPGGDMASARTPKWVYTLPPAPSTQSSLTNLNQFIYFSVFPTTAADMYVCRRRKPQIRVYSLVYYSIFLQLYFDTSLKFPIGFFGH